MNTFRHLLLVITAITGVSVAAQQTPAPSQKGAITITGATAHIGNGNTIDATSKHVYPGFIAPAKSLGLIEVNAVRASNDQDEIGEMIPHIRSIIAYNAESKVVESMRPNGVLIGQITPQGGTISGSSSIVHFDAWNWEDAAIKTDDGIHLHWPNTYRRGRWWAGEPRGYQPNKNYSKQTQKITSYLTNAKAFGMGKNQPANESFKAMQGLFDGSKKLYLYADGEKEIIDAITQSKQAGIDQIVLIGAYQGYKVIPFLKQHEIPVLVQQTHALPKSADDHYDLPYKLPKLLVDGGLLVGLQNSSMSNFQTRNLPFYAGQLVGQGMDKETALQLISGNTAQILGLDKYGSLEVGKSATLFISEGDALDMMGNRLIRAFIDGRDISLETHQTELWRRYMGKYNQE